MSNRFLYFFRSNRDSGILKTFRNVNSQKFDENCRFLAMVDFPNSW